MAKIKSKDKDQKIIKLSERQFYLLKLCNVALNYNTLKETIMSGFLYEICIGSNGYNEDQNLQFELDFESDTLELKVREIPLGVTEPEQPQKPE